jgi:hypothetical protein
MTVTAAGPLRPPRLLRYLGAMTMVSAAAAGAAATEREAPPRWSLFGDFRLRYEANLLAGDTPDRHRGVLRLRTGATFRINELLTAGARIVTGDPGDPRTADVTISDFLDDLELSFDRAYLEVKRDGGFATAGKFRNPFTVTELVWDADVNPTGAGGWVETTGVAGFTPRMTGMFMVVDEQTIGSDSTMWGVQARVARAAASGWSVDVAAAYWDYSIASLVHADDAGDRRGNATTADGSAYLSDFDLADVVVTLAFPGPSEALPGRLVVDYVRNLGAVDDEDEGLALEIYLGTPWVPHHFELLYAYGQCETDAVLGAFSHDNLPLATNYRSHTLRAAYGLLPETALSLTWYYFSRLHHPDDEIDPALDSFSSRIRLDLMVRF